MQRWIRLSSMILGFLSWISIPNLSVATGQSLPPGGYWCKQPQTAFAFSWLDDKNVFQAGDLATIKIKILSETSNCTKFLSTRYSVNLSVTVNEKQGNSSYISGVLQNFEDDPVFWNISFIPIRVGDFPLVISESLLGVSDSSLHFTVTAGHIYPSACMVFWMNFVNEFVAGEKAYISILLRDAFGNNISSGSNEPSQSYFMLTASYVNGSAVDILEFRPSGRNELGNVAIEFVPLTAGTLLLHVYGDNHTLSGSPLDFIVKPGPVEVEHIQGEWKYGTNFIQIFSKLELFILQKDRFGNLASGFYSFDARVVEKTTGLSIPVADLLFQEVADGTLLLSFTVTEPGEFTLVVFEVNLNESTWKMNNDFVVFIGYCHSSNSFANGTGITKSIAGRMSHFFIYLEDLYHNPSPVEVERLQVRFFHTNGTFDVRPIIFPLRNLAGRGNVAGRSDTPAWLSPSLPVDEDQTVIGKSSIQASDFNVAYIPRKSGDYEIRSFCGNIPVNDGNPYVMKVLPGTVDVAFSSVLKYSQSTEIDTESEAVVQLMDSYSNPVSSHQMKLRFQILSENNSSFIGYEFVDKQDGSYFGHYKAKDIGIYNVCVVLENMHISPCPFELHVHEKDYFPRANDDIIFVWEGESLSFHVLSNDHAASDQANISEYSKPLHGSLLQERELFRYTPYPGYFGKDSFSYTIVDANKNSASGTAFISVLCRPPQFISLPAQLHATEDVVSPELGGFPGFKIIYSDIAENLSVLIKAQFGAIFLAPMKLQIQPTYGSTLSMSKSGRAQKDLVVTGNLVEINYALQLIQYIGNENFYGSDVIILCASNKNGVQETHVPVFVKPINDPPILYAPKFINLGKKRASEPMQVFDKQRDSFDFSIVESDLFSFPGNMSHFVVAFSLEVIDGTLSTSLPISLINTAEYKSKSSNQWQPLQTFVTISNYFVLKGKAIRFRGTIGDCNGAMQRLFYQGSEYETVLVVTVNDLGNYGCSQDCDDKLSLPLQSQVTVNLVRKHPVGPMTAFLLGSIILVEIVTTLLLGALLLFFIIKCMKGLKSEQT